MLNLGIWCRQPAVLVAEADRITMSGLNLYLGSVSLMSVWGRKKRD